MNGPIRHVNASENSKQGFAALRSPDDVVNECRGKKKEEKKEKKERKPEKKLTLGGIPKSRESCG